MNLTELERFLAQSLADRKLSGGEKQALAAWLAQNVKSDQERGVARHAAFELASKTAADPDSVHLIEWLEDVLRVVAPVQQNPGVHTPGSPEAVGEAFFAPGEACMRHIVSRFQAARSTADVCVFTITDDRVSRSILDAHHRGVKVRVITDDDKMNDPGSDIRSFQAAGIPVKVDDVRGPAASGLGGHMHHKFAIFDGTRLLSGSYNWTRGAADMNYENLIDTTDPHLVAAFAAEFERLWKKF
jgi:phosphatidylserine/phosphatidylglycerophosphate/cardiolipin synthase-like enzyme